MQEQGTKHVAEGEGGELTLTSPIGLPSSTQVEMNNIDSEVRSIIQIDNRELYTLIEDYASVLQYICDALDLKSLEYIGSKMGVEKMKRLIEQFGNYKALHTCYLSSADSEEKITERTQILRVLCQYIGEKLVDAVIRPLSKNTPSVIELSANNDGAIINALLQLNCTHRQLDLLFEISRANAHPDELYGDLLSHSKKQPQNVSMTGSLSKISASATIQALKEGQDEDRSSVNGLPRRRFPITRPGVQSGRNNTSPRRTLARNERVAITSPEILSNVFSPPVLIPTHSPESSSANLTIQPNLTDAADAHSTTPVLKQNYTRAVAGRGRGAQREGHSPVVHPSARNRQLVISFNSTGTPAATDTANTVASIATIESHNKEKQLLFQHILGLACSPGLMDKLMELIQESYLNSFYADQPPLSILMTTLVQKVHFDDSIDTLTLNAALVIAAYCQVDNKKQQQTEAFLKNCSDNLLAFATTIADLFHKLDQCRPPIKDIFVEKLLSGKSLLAKAIAVCLEFPDASLVNTELFMNMLLMKISILQLAKYTDITKLSASTELTQSDNILFLFLRKLATSNLSPKEIQLHYQQFCERIGETPLRQLMLELNSTTQESVLHVLAKETSLTCLYSILEKQITSDQLIVLLKPGGLLGETPLHTAVRYQNVAFIKFCKSNTPAYDALRNLAEIPSKDHNYTLFHLIPVSCFTEKAWYLKAIFEGKAAIPEEPLSRAMLGDVVVTNAAHTMMDEVFELFGQHAGKILQQNDEDGNHALWLICYLNDPSLINRCMVIPDDGSDRNEAMLAKIANQRLPKTQATPTQLLATIGSAESFNKLSFMLGREAKNACLEINEYFGHINALGFCYFSQIELNNTQQRLALQEIMNALIFHIPKDSLEEALLLHINPKTMPVSTLSLLEDQWFCRELILEDRTQHQRGVGAQTKLTRPLDFMMDLLYEPPKRVLSASVTAKPLQRIPSHLSIFSAASPEPADIQNGTDLTIKPLMPIKSLRELLLKRLNLFTFIPQDLLENMVSLVTAARINSNSVDRKSILFDLLINNATLLLHNKPLNNFTCLFLALSYPAQETLSTNESQYCQIFLNHPEHMASWLSDFTTYLDDSFPGQVEAFYHQVYRSNSLLKKCLLLVFKDQFNAKDLQDKNLFVSKLSQIIAKARSNKLIVGGF